MSEIRYNGININGKVVQGVISSDTYGEVTRRIKALAINKGIKVTGIQKKRRFGYKIKKGNEKYITGEQKAYSREEVERALRKMGYNVLWVRTKIFAIEFKPSKRDIVMFIRLCADMLREKLNYNEILQLLTNDMSNKTFKNAIKEINKDLKEGKEGNDVFGKHSSIFGKFSTYMLSIASTSGDMISIYESTARFLEREEDFKKSIRQALIQPAAVVLAMFAAVIYYIAYIFPKTAEMFDKFDIPIPPMTKATLYLSNLFQEYIFWMTGICAVISLAVFKYFRTEKGKFIFDKYLISLPLLGNLFHKTSIEIFSRVFHSLYSGSGDNVAVIKIAAEACNNKYIEKQIKEITIPLMLKEGRGIVESLEMSGVFPQTALSRFRAGAETGTLKHASLQLAHYYEKETTYKLNNIIESIQVAIGVFIMIVLIALTIVSSETAVVRPKTPFM
ncbi:type II secretion system F family protein [candidate division KSB1 bacterium]